jgi:hypothetical protein
VSTRDEKNSMNCMGLRRGVGSVGKVKIFTEKLVVSVDRKISRNS